MSEQNDEGLLIPSLTVAEIRRGIFEKPRGKGRDRLEAWFAGLEGPRALFASRVLPFDEAAALIWTRLMTDGNAKGHPLSALDTIIADYRSKRLCGRHGQREGRRRSRADEPPEAGLTVDGMQKANDFTGAKTWPHAVRATLGVCRSARPHFDSTSSEFQEISNSDSSETCKCGGKCRLSGACGVRGARIPTPQRLSIRLQVALEPHFRRGACYPKT